MNLPKQHASRQTEQSRIAGDGPTVDLPSAQSHIDQIAEQIHQRLKHSRFVVAVSHDNYLEVVGGVQVHMLDEQDALDSHEVSYIQIYPQQHLAELAQSAEDLYVSMNVDSVSIGSFLVSDLVRIFRALAGRAGNSCLSIQLHHLLGWHLDSVSEIIDALNPVKRFFWLHDLFSICTQFTLLLNGRRFCNAPPLESNACTICRFGASRKRALAQFGRLFEAHSFTVTAPSRFTRDFWRREHPHADVSSHVVPHARLVKQEGEDARLPDKPLVPRYRPRLAFVGLPNTMKGWKIWRRLVGDPSISSGYELYHFGSKTEGDPPERFVSVSVTREDRHAMVEALRAHEIDMVFVWSIGPESFCFVLYEAMAAGCFIIARTNSGNVADCVASQGKGVVLESEDQLVEFLADGEKVRFCLSAFRRQHPHYCNVVRNFTVSEMIVAEDGQEEQSTEGVLQDAMLHFDNEQLLAESPGAWRDAKTA